MTTIGIWVNAFNTLNLPLIIYELLTEMFWVEQNIPALELLQEELLNVHNI